MKPVGIFGNNISKCPDVMRKRTPISPHRVPPVPSNKVKDYVSSVGSPCILGRLSRCLFFLLPSKPGIKLIFHIRVVKFPFLLDLKDLFCGWTHGYNDTEIDSIF